MPLNAKRRRELLAGANRLKVAVTIAGQDVSEATVEHVRHALAKRELLKVRIGAEDRDMCRLLADDLARRVPCELLTVIGRVAVLFSPQPEGEEPPTK